MHRTVQRLLLIPSLMLSLASAYAEPIATDVRQLQSQLDSLQQRLAQSEEALQSVNQTGQAQQSEILRLQQDNQRLKQALENTPDAPSTAALNEQQLWFVIGAGTSILSVLVGALLRRRRQSQWFH